MLVRLTAERHDGALLGGRTGLSPLTLAEAVWINSQFCNEWAGSQHLVHSRNRPTCTPAIHHQHHSGTNGERGYVPLLPLKATEYCLLCWLARGGGRRAPRGGDGVAETDESEGEGGGAGVAGDSLATEGCQRYRRATVKVVVVSFSSLSHVSNGLSPGTARARASATVSTLWSSTAPHRMPSPV